VQYSRFISIVLLASLLAPSFSFAQKTTSKSKAKVKQRAAVSKKSKKTSVSAKAAERKRVRKAAEAARARRLRRAFVASTDLKPMAKQLLEQRSKAAYSGVEKYAKLHKDTDAGALAWLLLGHAYLTETEPKYDRSIEALKNAKPHAGGLGDYVDLLLARAYRGKGSNRDVIVVLDGFANRHPDSLLAREASVMLANAYLVASAFEDALNALQARRTPARAEIELAVGKAYLGLDDKAKALEAFRTVYYQMPLSIEADEAGSLLKKYAAGEFASLEMRRQRAELLVRGRSYVQAISEYRQLVQEDASPKLKVALANALTKAARDVEAKDVLTATDLSQAETETKAQALYLLAEAARTEKDDARQAELLAQLTAAAPYSGWLQEALLSMGNKYLLRREFQNAADYYDQVAHRFPKDKGGSAHWKAAWLRYRLKDWPAAKQQFEEQVLLFPYSAEVPNALYWRGRLAEQDGEIATARAYYRRLNERFPNYYYALNARDRLTQIGDGAVAEVELLAKVPSNPPSSRLPESVVDQESARLQKSRLLANAALYDYAIRELQAAAAEPENNWAPAELAKLQEEAGQYHLALQTLKRAMPAYLGLNFGSLPRYLAEGLFPRPYWDALAKHSSANGLDPYLVAALIRQESEFNPNAISRANAYGLMQLLPQVGQQVAKQLKLKPYSTASLLEPLANIQLGTRYFRQMVDDNGGKVEYALAAYNAGNHRVTDWRVNGEFRDMPEFVESIPFTETREYVQAIVRNVSVYRQLYGTSTTAAVAGASSSQ
jgi:soluble lytic murein transglycosylase